MYLRREPLAYSSGLLSDCEGGLRAPACFGVHERDDGSIALWLEDCDGPPAIEWPLGRYRLAARHLGRAQAPFASGVRPLPRHRWLSRRWLSAYLERRAAQLERPVAAADVRSRLARIAFPHGSLVEWSQRTWAGRERILAVLESLPRTLCHLDFWPKNLFSAAGDGVPETIAIDWAYVGHGALGEDAGNLVPDSMLDFLVPSSEAARLTELVFAGFEDGLRDGGWHGDPRLPRLGLVASAAVKYVWMVPWLLCRARDESALEALERQTGRAAEEVFAARGEVMYALRELSEEAERLARELSLP
jgi:Phosphotransferase enzyme family